MAADKVTLANLALSKIGAERISSFGDDSSSARLITAIYDDVRDEVLTASPWSFATKRAVLAQSADPIVWTDDTMKYKYVKPTDFLKIIYTNMQNAWVKVEQDGILSDTTGLKMCYIFRNDDPTTYFALFTRALACRLAYEMCFNLVESSKKSEKLLEEYQMVLHDAIAVDSQQGTPTQAIQDEWEQTRLISGPALYAYPGRQTWTPTW